MSATGGRRFAGKVAIVTGGGSGIGDAVAARLVAEGAIVVAVDLKAEHLPPFDEDHDAPVSFLKIDVTSEEEVIAGVARVAAKHDRIDLLVNSAGIGYGHDVLETSLAEWMKVIGVNLNGSFLMSREAARRMVAQGGGAIVNMASIDAHAADPGYASYNTSKAAILGLTRSFAVELARRNVRVNSLSPALTFTPLVAEGDDPVFRDHILNDFKRVPIGRVLRPEEVAAACLYLLSDDAQAITGSDLLIDGGMMADTHLMSTIPTSARPMR